MSEKNSFDSVVGSIPYYNVLNFLVIGIFFIVFTHNESIIRLISPDLNEGFLSKVSDYIFFVPIAYVVGFIIFNIGWIVFWVFELVIKLINKLFKIECKKENSEVKATCLLFRWEDFECVEISKKYPVVLTYVREQEFCRSLFIIFIILTFLNILNETFYPKGIIFIFLSIVFLLSSYRMIIKNNKFIEKAKKSTNIVFYRRFIVRH